MTVGRKITLTCTALVLFCIAIGGISWLRFEQLTAINGDLAASWVPGIEYIGDISARSYEVRMSLFRYAAARDPGLKTQYAAAVEVSKAKLATAMKVYEGTIINETDRGLFARITESTTTYYQTLDHVVELGQSGKLDESTSYLFANGPPAYKPLGEAIGVEIAYNRKSADDSTAAALALAHTGQIWALLLTLSAAAAGSVLTWIVVQGITQALTSATNLLTDGAEQMKLAAGQVATSSLSLAEGATRQAATVEETAASAEEIGSMARSTSTNALSAADSVRKTVTDIQGANQKLQTLVKAMAEINEASGKISKIIKVIDEIAFQTNILALNAAVEAARAGEAGLGFAVVADEVRSLAQRSAQAAKDTAELIEGAIQKIQEGNYQVMEVERALATSNTQSSHINDLVEQISLSSGEQTKGLSQIMTAVGEMARAAQSTAATAEESAAASEQLHAQVESVSEIVGDLRSLIHS